MIAHVNVRLGLLCYHYPPFNQPTERVIEMKKIYLRASSMQDWSDCAKRAYFINQHEDRGSLEPEATHVGLACGMAVHRKITGQDYTEPTNIAFDKETRNFADLKRQIVLMTEATKKQLQELNLTTIESEKNLKCSIQNGSITASLSGFIDLVCKHVKTGKIYYVDLKTGKHPPRNAWMQMAIYCLLGKHNDYEYQSDYNCLIWIPRTIRRKSPTIYTKASDDLLPTAELILQRIMQAAHTEEPLPNPSSLKCPKCPVPNCPVRLT